MDIDDYIKAMDDFVSQNWEDFVQHVNELGYSLTSDELEELRKLLEE
jgi:hypothetical protein